MNGSDEWAEMLQAPPNGVHPRFGDLKEDLEGEIADGKTFKFSQGLEDLRLKRGRIEQWREAILKLQV